MILKYAIPAMLLMLGATPVLADTFYVQDTTTKKCTVVKEMSTTKITVIVKEAGLQFKSTAEAQAAIKKNQGLRN